MRLGTSYVLNDEPCFCLNEENRNGRRIQRLTVVREDDLADYIEDLGPSIPIPAVRVPGGERDSRTGKLDIWETVGELRHEVEEWRNQNFANQSIALPNLIEGYASLKGLG